jgi:hypothetical protein
VRAGCSNRAVWPVGHGTEDAIVARMFRHRTGTVMTLFGTTYVILWLVVLIQGILVLLLVHRLTQVRPAGGFIQPLPSELPIGGRAPEFSGIDVRSGSVLTSSILRGRITVLLFVSPECSGCKRLVYDLVSVSASLLDGVIVVCHGTMQSCAAALAQLAARVPILCADQARGLSEYKVSGLPVSVVINPDWTVADVRRPNSADHVVEALSPTPSVRSVA